MTATHRVWDGSGWLDLPVAESGGEAVVVPNVNGIVLRAPDRDALLLQRRDKPGEVVRGKLELPGGRWRAGETPDGALVREVAEETGVELLAVSGAISEHRTSTHAAYRSMAPFTVVSGVDGAYPSLHVVFECVGTGTPRDVAGETRDVRWWLLDDVESELASDPTQFVPHAAVVLAEWLGRR